jgi:hypothetical protein
MPDYRSIPDVAHVELIRGADAQGPPTVLIEAPHGATRREHFDVLAARMCGPLPRDLHEFFHLNTDVGSWEVGRRVAQRVVALEPTATVLVIRCLVPRTLIDTNRVVGADGGDLKAGGLTTALPPYVRDGDDHATLLGLHRAYTSLVERAYATVCGAGGLALVQHTYGPVTLGIDAIDDDIVHNLRAAHAPDVVGSWPLRAQVDLITRDAAGVELAPAGAADALVDAYADLGVEVVVGGTYYLHESTMGALWSARYPGRVLCLEIRRDLLVREWVWNAEMEVDPDAVDRFAGPLADVLFALGGSGR